MYPSITTAIQYHPEENEGIHFSVELLNMREWTLKIHLKII